MMQSCETDGVSKRTPCVFKFLFATVKNLSLYTAAPFNKLSQPQHGDGVAKAVVPEI